MPEYLTPEVYVEETGFRVKSIVGVATGTAAFIGKTEKGPVKPHLVKSIRDYIEVFGSVFGDKQYMPDAVEAFFDNGGTRCFVVRIVPEYGSVPSVADFEGVVDDSGKGSGLAGLLSPEYDEVAVINAPAASDEIVKAVIKHCEKYRFRFAVIDSPPEVPDLARLDPGSLIHTSYAAFYYPWLLMKENPLRSSNPIPPGGVICGVYARTDLEKGVHKAPANQVVKKVVEVVNDVSEESQGLLNLRGVNVIRDFGRLGIRVWGARTLDTGPELKYVNVRRYLIYLERSIEQGTQWDVFEPNSEGLWGRLRQTVEQFLLAEWRNGGLLGATPQDAFFVMCDRTTMTQNDIDNGRLICEIGVALTRPAEFVIFRIIHKISEPA